MTSGLPRDVLRWLQSLGLALPVRNPKRDFANGYLVAEIFSRYYPNQLQVWLFYTGDSSAQRANNWEILAKFFKKNNVNVPKEAMEAVMHCHGDAAVRFVENVYMLLTNRRLPERRLDGTREAGSGIDGMEDEVVPHYALPTTSNVIRAMGETPSKARVVEMAHEEFLDQLREQRGPEVREIMRAQARERAAARLAAKASAALAAAARAQMRRPRADRGVASSSSTHVVDVKQSA